MMILSSIYNTKQTLGLYTLLLGVIIYLALGGEYIAAIVVSFALLATLLLSLMDGNIFKTIFDDPLVMQIRDILIQAGEGHLSQRITHIDEKHAMEAVAWGINSLLDQTEQFMRDISASVEAANVGIKTRHIPEKGYHGDFRQAIPELNTAIRSVSTSYISAQKSAIAKEFNDNSEGGISKGLSIIQDDILQNLTILESISSSTKDTAEEATSSQTVVQDITDKIEELIQLITNSNESISSLSHLQIQTKQTTKFFS